MTLNFLHLKKELFAPDTPQYKEALFRERNIECQVFEQRIFDYKVWDGIIDKQMPFRGISDAHKQIIQDAKNKGLKMTAVIEDDVYMSHPNSWKYFLKNMPEEFDLYFATVYKSIINKNNKIEFGFSGLSCYVVHERFYQTFLDMKSMNNLDRELGRFAWKYKYMVCEPFICHQHSGFSFHQGKEVGDYTHLLDGRELYNG